MIYVICSNVWINVRYENELFLLAYWKIFTKPMNL